jgi:multidrug transporter EmrE-like cation transporter
MPNHVFTGIRSPKDFMQGLALLGADIILNITAQFILKRAMVDLGEFHVVEGWMDYIFSMANIEIIGGLLLYGVSIGFWLACLSKLDLSFAYTAATVQYVLVYWGGWYLFGEALSQERIVGLVVIFVGVVVISLDYRNR